MRHLPLIYYLWHLILEEFYYCHKHKWVVFVHTHVKYCLIIKKKLIIKWFSILRKSLFMCVQTLFNYVCGRRRMPPDIRHHMLNKWKVITLHFLKHNLHCYYARCNFLLLVTWVTSSHFAIPGNNRPDFSGFVHHYLSIGWRCSWFRTYKL